MEESFPPALVDRINATAPEGIRAEHLKTGGVEMAAPSGYGVIVDRISHDIPFYRAYLKNAVLTGTKVINNPFWWSADDKFFNFSLATKLGVAIPPTVLLPHKHYPPGTIGALHAQPDVSARLGRHLPLRRLSRVSEAARRRRLERCVQGQLARGILRRLRSKPRPLHDAAARRKIPGILPLLHRQSREGARHALRSRRAPSSPLCSGKSGRRARTRGTAWCAIASRCAARWATI